MAKLKPTGENLGDLKEEIVILSESDKSDWLTGLIRVSWSGAEPKIEIRKYNKTLLKENSPRGWGKGIALTPAELDVLTEELVRLGYGSNKEIKVAFKERSHK